MRHTILTVSGLALGVLTARGVLPAQSLGEIARQERAKRASERHPAAKVWTNDNIPKAARIEPAPPNPETVAPPQEPAPPPTEAAPPAAPPESAETPGEAKKHDKDYWQARFKAARAQLADAKERQGLAEDELNLLRIQEVRELDPTAKQDLQAKATDKSAEVDQARAVTEKAQKALDDLQKEFDASGAPDDWSKSD